MCYLAFSPTPRRGRAKPVSTVLNCITHTHIRWPHSCPGPIRAKTPMAGSERTACACLWRSTQQCVKRYGMTTSSAAVCSPMNASMAAAAWRTLSISQANSAVPEWISFRRRAAESLMTPVSRASATRSIPTPGPVATSACRNTFPTSAAPLGATSSLRLKSDSRCERRIYQRQSCAPAVSIISRWRRGC